MFVRKGASPKRPPLEERMPTTWRKITIRREKAPQVEKKASHMEKKGSQHSNFEGEIFHEGQASTLALPPPLKWQTE